ncbi:MAG: hypothetical protein ACJ795_15030 [Ktedonobacteraceae bacterium]
MRAAAVALVLIVGAAVVLWYGNTLDSWVLGGLIGGLAALLISIPISLMLFSYLARRNDERAKAEAQEEMSLALMDSYDYLEPPVEIYENEADMLPSAEDDYDSADDYRGARGRNLPAPSSYPRLPVVRQQLLPAEQSRYRQQKDVLPGRTREQPAAPRQQPKTSQPLRYPGFPGYHVDAQRSAHHTAALRAARQEAAQQYGDGETRIMPTSSSKRLSTVRPEQRIMPQPSVQPRVPRHARQLQPQPQAPQQYQRRRTVDGSSGSSSGNRSLPRPGEGVTGQLPQGRNLRGHEAQTDKIGERYPQTGPVRRQTTDHLARHRQVDGQPRSAETISGSLKNPLVRRAPYMYEDDPLRQELAQHIESPLVRRSSRYEEYDEEED